MRLFKLLFLGSFLLTLQLRSAVIVTISEVAGGVQASGVGSFNFFGDSLATGFGTSGLFSTNENVAFGDAIQNPNFESIVSGSGFLLPNFLGPTSFGFSSDFLSDTNSGDGFVFSAQGTLLLPDTYIPGSELSSSAFYAGETISSIGLSAGSRLWTWDAGAGNVDSFTLSVVPEPKFFTFLFMFLFVLSVVRRRTTTI